MAARKKLAFTKLGKALVIGETKRFVTIISKYFPDSKEKKEILKKFEEVSAIVEKSTT